MVNAHCDRESGMKELERTGQGIERGGGSENYKKKQHSDRIRKGIIFENIMCVRTLQLLSGHTIDHNFFNCIIREILQA